MITLRRQLEIEAVFLITMAGAISLFFVMYRNNYQPQFGIASSVPSSMSIQTETISPKITVSSQISPDGAKKVIMKVTENQDNTATYEISTADENGSNQQSILTKTLYLPNNIEIPFNTWSPDNKYFFIEQNIGVNKSVLVFKTTGDPFADMEAYLNVGDLFRQKETGNNFDRATGWASETLIIINTTKPDGSKGPSYWFEVPSKAIIQLSSGF